MEPNDAVNQTDPIESLGHLAAECDLREADSSLTRTEQAEAAASAIVYREMQAKLLCVRSPREIVSCVIHDMHIGYQDFADWLANDAHDVTND
jgi:hypothetical protein